jgi:chromosomal replication initiator protein
LAGGLVVNLASLGLHARRELVLQEAARTAVRLDDGQVSGLVQSAEAELATARGLRRAVTRLAAGEELKAQSSKLKVDEGAPEIVCRLVAAAAAREFGVTLKELKGKSRRQAIVEARSLAMHVARLLTSASYAQIGQRFGKRDHTTVLHACRKTEQRIEHDEFMRRVAEEIASQVAAETGG